MPRDYSKYKFNGKSYPKGRLVLAVVKAYIEQEQPDLQQLRKAFPKDLQGSIGVFYTEQEYNARKLSSNDKSERFFKNLEDRLTTSDGEQILICTEWGKDNVSQFVEHSNELGFDISLEPSDLSDERIIENFVHKPAFKRNYKNWPEELLGNFCDLMRSVHEAGLDIFTVDMSTGGSIRIGRKGHGDKVASEVFATFEPCQNKINFVQRYLHNNAPLKGELNDDLLEQIKASDDLQKFYQEHPISRAPLWPDGYQDESNKLNVAEQQLTPMNQILYGPPGTGKTYRTVQMAVDAAEPTFKPSGQTKEEVRNSYKERYDKLTSEGRVRFVTFHQSYGYEEFVEGLSAKTEGDQLSYFEKDGIFKTICDEAQKFRLANEVSTKEEFDEHWEQFSQTLAESESGIKIKTLSKKTYFTVTDVTNNTIRFDKSKGESVHTLSVKTLRAVYNGEKVIKGGLQPYYGALIEYMNQITVQASDISRERKHFVLIIDEINRGNISKIFGELITLIEPSKRLGQPESLEVVLPYSGDAFTVPDNLYLIGTMNTADRSLALMDTALRRRFDFVEMMPDYSVLRDNNGQPYCIVKDDNSINLVELLQTLNNRISALYDREHTLGHAFLMPVVDAIKAGNHALALEELAKCFQNKVIPLLAEYFFEDWQKIRLVLGDNQKEQKDIEQLIERSMVEFDSLFGDTADLDLMDDEAHDYRLVEPDSQLWFEPQTYVGMYDLNQLVG